MIADADIIWLVKAKPWPRNWSRNCASTSRTVRRSGGPCDDAAEDAHVRVAAHALAQFEQSEAAPLFTGIGIKSFERLARRAASGR